MSVDFQPGDQIRHTGSKNVYTYVGVKGYGTQEQFLYKGVADPSRLGHFETSQAHLWEKYTPGLEIGKTYKYKVSDTGNTYRILAEWRDPNISKRTWFTEFTYGPKGIDPGQKDAATLYEYHVDKLEEVTSESDDSAEW